LRVAEGHGFGRSRDVDERKFKCWRGGAAAIEKVRHEASKRTRPQVLGEP
jgi:hypothetical protein